MHSTPGAAAFKHLLMHTAAYARKTSQKTNNRFNRKKWLSGSPTLPQQAAASPSRTPVERKRAPFAMEAQKTQQQKTAR
jgi:hypothetical protein